MAKRGRKELVFTQKDHEMVKTMLAFGTPINVICCVLSAERGDDTKLSRTSFDKHFGHYKEYAAEEINTQVVGHLFKEIKRGNVTAIKFWLQCRAGWIPTEERKNTGELPVKFTLQIDGPKLEKREIDASDFDLEQ